MDRPITKNDTPYCARPAFLALIMVNAVVLYIIALYLEPMFWPGIMDIAFGVCFGLPAGIAFSCASIAYYSDAARVCQKDEAVKFFACIRNYPRYSSKGAIYYLQMLGAVVGGMALIVVGQALYHLAFGRTVPPWIPPREGPADDLLSAITSSVPATVPTYMLTLLAVYTYRVSRWYNSLPDHSGDDRHD